MLAVRYRTGLDPATGKILRGQAHLAQSLVRIWLTRTDTRVMLLDFGSDLRSHLAEDITPALALEIYDDLITAAHRWEPEYRIGELQLVTLTRVGGLGLRHAGTYFPEGRFGNFEIQEPFGTVSALAAYERLARRAA